MKTKDKKKLLVDKKECHKCGHLLEKSAKFCSECGNSATKKCSNCGNDLDETSKMCDECGYNVGLEESIILFSKKFNQINEAEYTMYGSGKDKGKVKKNLPQAAVDPDKITWQPGDRIVVADEADEIKYNKNTKTFNKEIGSDQLKSGDKIQVADEGRKKVTKRKTTKRKTNPWAICTSSVGRENKKKYEKCIMDIKKKQKIDEDLQRLEEYIERLITDSEVNPKIKKGNFKEFISKIK